MITNFSVTPRSVLRATLCAVLLCALMAPLALVAGAPQGSKTKGAVEHVPDFAIVFCTVWDAHDRPVYGVPVRLRLAGEKKFRDQAFSDHHGELGFHVTKPGQYVLQADIKVPKGKSKPEVMIEVNSLSTRFDTSIHLPE